MHELILAAALLGQPTPMDVDTNVPTNNLALPTSDIYGSPAPEATESPLPQEAIIMNEIIDGFLKLDKNSPFYQEMIERQRSNFHEYFHFSYDETDGGFESNFGYFPEGFTQNEPIDKISYSFGSYDFTQDDGTQATHLEAAMFLRVGEDGTLENNSLPEIGRFSKEEMINLASKYFISIPPFELLDWTDIPETGGIYKAIDLDGVYISMEVTSDGRLTIYQESTEIPQ